MIMKTPSYIGVVALTWLAVAVADTTINPTDKYAYGANTGWWNLRPSTADGISVNESFLSGFAYGANVGWIQFGDGSPANGHTYANHSATDYGVNHDGAGNLSGYAYGANIGWINFGWAADSDALRPRIDLLSGEFTGFAYSANTGWINLGAGYLKTDSLDCPDSDGDGIADPWERSVFGDLTTATASSDHDGDGQTDKDEYDAATDAKDPKSFSKIVSHSYDGTLTQTTVEFTTSAKRFYRLETSTDLGTWIDSGLGTFKPGAGAATTKIFTSAEDARRYLRARALKPLQP